MSQTTSPHLSSKDDTKLTITGVLKGFLQEAAYRPPNISSTNEDLEANMRSVMNHHKIGCAQLEKTLHLAASLIELAFQGCTLAEKTTIAIFNWFIIYIDDTSPKDPSPFVVFGKRFLSHTPQLDPVLDVFADFLLRICDEYDIPAANYILSAAFNYVNSTCLEPQIELHTHLRGVSRFPWFFRSNTGVSLAFALMLFPKSKGVSVAEYVQVLEDMNFWISGVNDILSFPKEELAGDTNNYIHIRSHVEGKPPLKVLTELSQELQASQNLICATLAHIPGAVDIWTTFEHGYILWHLIQERYKLADLNLFTDV